MNRRSFIWAVILLAAFLISCGTAQDDGNDYSDVEMLVQTSDGVILIVDDLGEIQDSAPFTILYPQGLPENVRLKTVRVSVPPSAASNGAGNGSVRVLLQYTDDTGGFAFQLTESQMEPVLAHPNLSTVQVDIPGGGAFDLNILEDSQSQFISASWTGCGIGFVLSGSMEGEFGADWPPRIARSIVDSCELVSPGR